MAHWNAQGGPFKEALNNAPKHVASTNLEEPLPRPTSTLRGHIAAAVSALKAQPAGVLAIMGGGELIGSLMAADPVDEHLLRIHPLVVGSGRRLFRGKLGVSLRLTGSVTTPTGILVANHDPQRKQWTASTSP